MADNVILPGTGTPVATDDIGGVHYQRVKLVTAEDAASEPIGDDDKGSSRSLWSTIRPNLYDQSQNSAGLTNASYAAGEVLGTGWVFTNAARAAGGALRVHSISVLDKVDLLTTIQLWFARDSITFGTDNNTPSISDSDGEKLLPGGIGIALTDLGGLKWGSIDGLDLWLPLTGTSLYVYATTPIALGSGWAVATDIRINIIGELA